MDEDLPQPAVIDFVPSICFVPRGVAKERPDKIALTQTELARVIKDMKTNLESDDNNDASVSESEMDVEGSEEVNEDVDTNDEFNLSNYQNEEDSQGIHISNIVDPDDQIPDESDDSDAEDEIIKPSDNLILVGHVQDDSASLEVWIFNEEDESLYTHHDFLLHSFPLCIEWLNHDPGSEKAGNMCAIGSMDPIITIWDLDIQDSIEPIFKLGSKGKRKKNIKRYGHTDAVLDLSWNRNFEHILASGSVDQTLILWDLDKGLPHTTVTTFEEKVQTVDFNSVDTYSLLAGCANGAVYLFDCRNLDQINAASINWKTTDEIEKVLWKPNDPNIFLVGTNNGFLHLADKRQNNRFLWTKKGHEEEISGMCFNNQLDNMLISSSTDGFIKIWQYDASEVREIYSHDFEMGRLQCMAQCPEDPFTLAFGGEKAPRCRIFNIKNFEAVRSTFNIPEAQ